jgi:hypothetical protein
VAAATRCKAGSIVRSRRRAGWLAALALIGLTFCLAPEANAACIDLKQANKLSFEGILNYRIFAGPPNYEDVRKGDAPEPTYILTLTEPICASGDEFVDPGDKFHQCRFSPVPPTKPLRRCRETFAVWSESELLWKGLRRLARIPDITMPRWCCP